MSHFSFTQRSGCSEILELLDISNLLVLNDTVARKTNAWTKHEAISVILSHSQSAEELLKRRKVTRESILKYLTEHGMAVSTSSSKQQLIDDALLYWIQPLATSSHLLPFQLSAETARSVTPLVHSSSPTQTTSSPGTFPCNRRVCNTCRFTSSLDFIQGPNQSFQVQQRFTCTSFNLVYCIRCFRCQLLYIGETKRRLGDRFAQHLRSVRTNQPGVPVAQHFNSPSHSESDLSVLGLLHCHDYVQRKCEEQQLILHLGSLHPSGMNIDMSNF
ncbi:uncharacterized protein LOC129702942 [Leucoraja erinacea]|uniref:uncharacterized protein LOC129702942 n=1 Tax=Leucoraja erinaceus TaxID=7782 RepID=UPI0024579099|nr:uncharacterized protein LOC129702942 [Leucoraja erinacea]